MSTHNPSPALVQPGSFLTLHYRLAGPAGPVIDTFAGKPATLTLGSGALAPALEQRLLGLAEGSQASFELPAGTAFGQRNPAMLQWLAQAELEALGQADEHYQVGDLLQLATPDGNGRFGGIVRELRQDQRGAAVLLDFNHPLAGQPVTFAVHVIGIL